MFHPAHISDDLLRELDRQVGEAIEAVQGQEAAQVQVALLFTVKPDDDGNPTVEYTAKDTRQKKGSWTPSVHPRLPFERTAAGAHVAAH